MTIKETDKTPDELRESLLQAALPHVAFDGWSNATLTRTAEDNSVDIGMVNLAFPKGSIDMIDLYCHLYQYSFFQT
jgi:ubiquinone biosynthesis protein COQ9